MTTITPPSYPPAYDQPGSGDLPVSDAATILDDTSIRGGLADFVARVRDNRATVGAACMWLAILAFIAAAAGFTPGNRLLVEVNTRVGWAVIASVIGIMLMGAALRLHPRSTPGWLADAIPTMTGTWRPALVLAGLLLLAAGTVVSTGLVGMAWIDQVGPVAQFMLLLAGLLLLATGLIGVRSWRLPRPRWGDVGVVGLILVGTFIVRAGGLDHYVRWPVDEVHFTSAVETFYYNNVRVDLLTNRSVFLPVTMLYSFFNAGTVELFGWNWTGARITGAVFGVFTVLAVYGAAYAVFNRRTALVAALIAMAFPPFVQFGRISMPHMGDALFGTMLVLFIARGVRWNRRSDWVWAGVSLGLTQYFFEGGRYSFPALTVGFFLWTVLAALVVMVYGRVTKRRQADGEPVTYGRLRPYLGGWVLLAVAFVCIAAPVYLTMLANGSPFGSRLNASGVGVQYLIDGLLGRYEPDAQMWFNLHITDPFLIYTFNADRPGLWYSNNTAMVLQPFIPFFLLGVAHAVWRGRTAAFMLVSLLLLASAGSTLLSDTLWYVRYMMIMPVVALIIGIGISETLPLLWGGGRVFARGVTTALLLIALAIAGGVTVVHLAYYFGTFVSEYQRTEQGFRTYRDGVDAVQTYMTLDAHTEKHLILIDNSTPDTHVPRQMHSFFLARQTARYSIDVADSDLIGPAYFYALPRDRTYVFAVEPWDHDLIAQMRRTFTVLPPLYSQSPYLPPQRAYILFVAPHTLNLPNSHTVAAFPLRAGLLEE